MLFILPNRRLQIPQSLSILCNKFFIFIEGLGWNHLLTVLPIQITKTSVYQCGSTHDLELVATSLAKKGTFQFLTRNFA